HCRRPALDRSLHAGAAHAPHGAGAHSTHPDRPHLSSGVSPPPWPWRAHVTLLTLRRLAPPQATQMMRRMTGDRPLPMEIVQQIVAKTDGVPLFVEERTKVVLESELLRARARA